MGLWAETIGIAAVALCGLLAGRWASRRPVSRAVAMAAAMMIVAVVLLARISVLWDALPGLCPISAGRLRFILLSFAVTLGLSTPLSQLRNMVSRYTTCVIMSIFLAILITLPFIGPALVQGELAALPTRFDSNGVCRQSQPFTCGPAAAVTALNHFGLAGDEGRLAVASRTSPIIGTSPWNLCKAINDIYGGPDLQCEFRHLGSLEQIPSGSIVLTIVEDAVLTDHCVAIMAVSDQTVTVADPVDGLIHMPRNQFTQQWRNCGIILKRSL